jgi:hypothetical protein
MSQSEAVSKALAEAREYLEALQLKVRQQEQVLDSLEGVAQLVNGETQQKRKYVKKAVTRKAKPRDVIGWNEALRKALSSGVIYNRRSLAEAALAARKSGSKGAAYQGVLHGLRRGILSEANSGVITWASKQ